MFLMNCLPLFLVIMCIICYPQNALELSAPASPLLLLQPHFDSALSAISSPGCGWLQLAGHPERYVHQHNHARVSGFTIRGYDCHLFLDRRYFENTVAREHASLKTKKKQIQN